MRLGVHDSNDRAEPNHVTDLDWLTCLDAYAVDGCSRSRTEIFDGKLFVSGDQRRMNAADVWVV